MNNVKELVLNFREKTIDMLKCFDSEDYYKLQILLSERQKIINLIEENPKLYNKKQIADEFKRTDIMELDKKVNELIHKNMIEIKEKLKIINSDILLRKKYNTGFSGNSLFFNKKIY